MPQRPSSVRAHRAGARTAIAYHHGDLRRALLAATEAVLDEAGVEAFTLREVARRAGVSHGAPAHHFGDARGLLSAFSAQSFEQLVATMQSRRDAAPAGAFDQLVAVGLAYVDYALHHRARFRLMFRTDRLDRACDPLVNAGAQAYQQLVECVAALDPAAGPASVAERTALAWSIVHGFAMLLLENANFAAQQGEDAQRALARLERLLVMSRTCFERRPAARPRTRAR